MDFILPVVIADFRIPSIICLPELLIPVNNSQTIGDNHSFFWDFGDGTTSTQENPTHQYARSGIYFVKLVVTDGGTCNFLDSIVKRIVVLASSKEILPLIAICAGDRVQIGIPPAPSGEITYRWEPEEGLDNPRISNPVVTTDTSIIYTLFIETEECADTLIQEIIVRNVDVEMPADTLICFGETITITPVNHTPDPTIRYMWADNPYFVNPLNSNIQEISFTITPTSTTRYYLKVVNGDCEFIYSIVVTVSKIVIEPLSQLVSCFGESVEINPNITCIHCNEFYYQWSGDTSSILTPTDQASIIVLPLQNSVYSLTVTNDYGCSVSETFTVLKQGNTFEYGLEVWTNNHVITEIIDTTTLYSTVYTLSDYHYKWSPIIGLSNPNAPTTLASPAETTLYALDVTDHFGCTKSDTVLIIVEPIICKEPFVFVPNAFTPNRDNLNDVLYVRGDVVEKILFRVYNRLGELVFESQNMQYGWDGTYKGKEAPAAVYDYYLEVTCYNKTYYLTKGNVLLLR